MLYRAPTIDEIRSARERLGDAVVRTPLLKWNGDGEIYLKLENLQPIGSFKIRGAGNAMLSAGRETLKKGVWTASAGNMAQGAAWFARRLGLQCTAVVPDQAPEIKLAALHRLDCSIVKVPFAEWWQILVTHQFEKMQGLFIHPVCGAAVMAGNGTIGLELLEDLPDLDTVLIPYGGGGLSSGIATALKSLRPQTKVYACEPETAAPFAAAMSAGKPVEISFTPSFVDGAGGRSMLPGMWEIASSLLAGGFAVPLSQTEDAIRLLVERHHVVAEGAGALPLAAALMGHARGKTVCVISGGNLNPSVLAEILQNH